MHGITYLGQSSITVQVTGMICLRTKQPPTEEFHNTGCLLNGVGDGNVIISYTTWKTRQVTRPAAPESVQGDSAFFSQYLIAATGQSFAFSLLLERARPEYIRTE